MGRRSRITHPVKGGPRPAGAVSPRVVALAGVIVFVLSCAAFLPALGAGFSDFDDHGFLLEATGWRGLGPENLSWMATAMRLGHYQPLTYLSYAIDYTFWGMDPRGYHATNILLHAGNAVLLMFVLMRVLTLGGAAHRRGVLFGAAAASILWAVHPLRVESVAWITERRDVLSAFFLLLCTLAYLRAARPVEAPLASRRAYVWCLALLLCSLLAKAWGITFIAVVLALDVWPLQRLPWQVWRWGAFAPVLQQKIPIAGLCVVFALLAWMAQRTGHDETMRSFQDWGWAARGFQACYGVVFYLWKTIAPVDLVPLYELPMTFDAGEARWWIAAGLVIVMAVAVGLIARRHVGIGVAMLLYVILLSPVLGIAQSGIQLVADRYAYLALWPIAGLLAAGLGRLWAAPARLALVRATAVACLLAAMVLGTMSWRQCGLWGDTLRLWETTIARGHDGPVTRNYLARQLEKAGRHADAIREYEASLTFNPRYEDSWFGMGNALRSLGQHARAQQAFLKSIEVARDPMRSQIALGLLRVMHLNDQAGAIEAFAQAVETAQRLGNPQRTGTPYLMLASAYGEAGDIQRAIPLLREAAKWPDTRAQAIGFLRDLGVSP